MDSVMAPKAGGNWTFSVEDFAEKFGKRWFGAREDFIASARILVQAKDQKLDAGKWERLKHALPVSDSVIKKLLPIGRDARLRKPALYKLLPSNYSIIYEITQLNDEELESAIKDGQISPRMHRASFIAWRKAHRGDAEGSDSLNPLQIGFLMPTFAQVLADVSISPSAALDLKRELDALAKRYRGQVQYPERGILQTARLETLTELGAKLQKLLARYNQQVDQKDLALMENALWQHRLHEAGDLLPYEPTQRYSIENPSHTYGLQAGWHGKRMIEEMERRKIITMWTPIKNKSELGAATCLQLALRYLETKDIFERRQHAKELRKIAGLKSKHSQLAQQCLDRILPFEEFGIR
jgi:hypothetical protein